MAEDGVPLADEPADVALREPGPGGAAGDEHRAPVDGDLHAHEGARLARDREVHDGVRDRVGDLVGVPGGDGLGGTEADAGDSW